jgi:hypothetical protein
MQLPSLLSVFSKLKTYFLATLIFAAVCSSSWATTVVNDFKNGFTFTGASATQGPFTLLGGRYAIGVAATWGGGTVEVDLFLPDNSTLVDVMSAPFAANGTALVDLPPGKYQVTITTATSVVFFLIPVSTSRASP